MKLLCAVALALVACVFASSHSEAPGAAKILQADVTDFYMFQSYETGREDYTVFIMNVQPLQSPIGGPNYFALSDEHFYEIYVDNDGDTREDISFQMFCGNRLGGNEIDVRFESDEDDDCNALHRVADDKKRSFGIEPLTVRKAGGVTLPIAPGHDVPIALKVFGVNTAGDESGLNFFEWCRINTIFGDRTNGRRERVTLVDSDEIEFRKPFDYAGEKSFPDYETYARSFIHDINLPDCNRHGRFFVGQRKEPFFIRLGGIFDIINFVPIDSVGLTQSPAFNELADLNIDSFVLEIPTECLTNGGDGSGILSAHTAVRELHHNGDAHVPGKQVSRLGNPLVNELFVGLRDKGRFNRDEPKNDGQFLEYVQYPTLPFIVDLLFRDTVNSAFGISLSNLAPTNLPRDDLVAAFLTGLSGVNQPPNVVAGDQLRLNTNIAPTARSNQNSLGVAAGDLAGFPNGRRPGDDAVDIALRAAMGVLCHLDLGLCTADQAPIGDQPLTDGAPISALDFDASFPFLTTPTPGARTPA